MSLQVETFPIPSFFFGTSKKKTQFDASQLVWKNISRVLDSLSVLLCRWWPMDEDKYYHFIPVQFVRLYFVWVSREENWSTSKAPFSSALNSYPAMSPVLSYPVCCSPTTTTCLPFKWVCHNYASSSDWVHRPPSCPPILHLSSCPNYSLSW